MALKNKSPKLPYQWGDDERPALIVMPDVRPVVKLTPRAVAANLNAELADMHVRRRAMLAAMSTPSYDADREGADRQHVEPRLPLDADTMGGGK